MENSKQILLNWLPPSMETWASPSLSVLKAYLEKNGYKVQVKYWNLEFNSILKNFFNFGNLIYENDVYKLLPFYSYLAIKRHDIILQERIKYYILKQKPQLHSKGEDFIDRYLLDFYSIIDSFIDKELEKIKFNDFISIGFSTQFYQWIIANIIVDKIKNISPQTVVIAGGFGTKQEALAFIENFSHYDYTSWGEGEYPLLSLTKYIDNNKDNIEINNIPNIVYKKGNEFIVTSIRNQFVTLDESEYDYSDYFDTLSKYSIDLDISIPIEGGRGCHWKKCKFCFLNSGYKYRTKSPNKIISEIRASIYKHNTTNISFLDNDIIGGDLNRFNHLLDLLIDFRSEYDSFNITLAEVITKNLDSEVLKKMSLAGFKSIQIGYESPSNKLLKKINKKNSFASNLFFIKWGTFLGFKISGANVLRGLLEETDDNIKEGIHNLSSLRFFLQENIIKHNISSLAIAESSPYYKQLPKKIISEYQSSILNFLPNDYIKEEDKHKLLFDFVNHYYNRLWDVFESVESFYLNNRYEYKILKNNTTIYYRELYNQVNVKELEFDIDRGIHWQVLEKCNHQIQSIDILESLLDLSVLSKEESLKSVIRELNNEGLLYCDEDMTEIVSIINTDLVN